MHALKKHALCWGVSRTASRRRGFAASRLHGFAGSRTLGSDSLNVGAPVRILRDCWSRNPAEPLPYPRTPHRVVCTSIQRLWSRSWGLASRCYVDNGPSTFWWRSVYPMRRRITAGTDRARSAKEVDISYKHMVFLPSVFGTRRARARGCFWMCEESLAPVCCVLVSGNTLAGPSGILCFFFACIRCRDSCG